jgi:hypothetical protein
MKIRVACQVSPPLMADGDVLEQHRGQFKKREG